ncbi:MAG: DUF1249 domain-containing protein [Pseudomonadota bacterium]
MKHRITLKVVPQSESPRAAVLRDLLAVAEANHALLMQLMPGMREQDSVSFGVTGPSGQHADVRLTVRERGPFTTLIDVVETHATDGWVAPMRATVRLSHDARVAEVTEFRRRRRLQARYPYPNPDMLHPDEKLQTNRLLGEWLQHCLRWGEAREACLP